MKSIFSILFIIINISAFSQELYINAEPASNIPKGVLGVRSINKVYKEVNTMRSMHAIRFMYGITPRLMVWVQPNITNHHDDVLPEDLLTHTHVGNQTNFKTNNIKLGGDFGYSFNGFHFYTKYLFLKRDSKNQHFRMAAYAEAATNLTAHDEAEPNLYDDNQGYGGGLVTTWLKKRLAMSLTTGFIIPSKYSEIQGDEHISTSIELDYGRAITYSFSIGYLLSPSEYIDYQQPNYNIYIEFLGKAYEGASVNQNGELLPIESSALLPNSYLEIHPGIQKIINSNTRIEFSVGYPLIDRTYTHTYPLYTIQLQHYFYW